MLLPFYVEIGDFAVAYVVAHEFGHSLQRQVGARADAQIAFELQADCYAGAWAANASARRLLEPDDLKEGMNALYSVGDLPGTKWADPQAHGTAQQRITAFRIGLERGASQCAQQTL